MNLIFHEIKWIKTLLTLAGFSCPTALTMTSEVSVGFVGAVSTIKAWAGIARLYLWKSKFRYSQFLKSLQYSEREKRKLRICRSQAASFFSFRVCENNYVMYVTLTSPWLLIEDLQIPSSQQTLFSPIPFNTCVTNSLDIAPEIPVAINWRYQFSVAYRFVSYRFFLHKGVKCQKVFLIDYRGLCRNVYRNLWPKIGNLFGSRPDRPREVILSSARLLNCLPLGWPFLFGENYTALYCICLRAEEKSTKKQKQQNLAHL